MVRLVPQSSRAAGGVWATEEALAGKKGTVLEPPQAQ